MCPFEGNEAGWNSWHSLASNDASTESGPPRAWIRLLHAIATSPTDLKHKSDCSATHESCVARLTADFGNVLSP